MKTVVRIARAHEDDTIEVKFYNAKRIANAKKALTDKFGDIHVSENNGIVEMSILDDGRSDEDFDEIRAWCSGMLYALEKFT